MWRVLVAAGLSAGVALGLVGTGVEGAFTSAVSVQSEIIAGTFSLALDQIGEGQGDGSELGTAGAASSGGDSPSALPFQFAQAEPGSSYYDEFRVADVGSVPGSLSTLAYTPSGGAVPPGTTLQLKEQVGGVWTDVGEPLSAGAAATVTLADQPTLLPSGDTNPGTTGVSALVFVAVVHVGSSSSSAQLDIKGQGQDGGSCGGSPQQPYGLAGSTGPGGGVTGGLQGASGAGGATGQAQGGGSLTATAGKQGQGGHAPGLWTGVPGTPSGSGAAGSNGGSPATPGGQAQLGASAPLGGHGETTSNRTGPAVPSGSASPTPAPPSPSTPAPPGVSDGLPASATGVGTPPGLGPVTTSSPGANRSGQAPVGSNDAGVSSAGASGGGQPDTTGSPSGSAPPNVGTAGASPAAPSAGQVGRQTATSPSSGAPAPSGGGGSAGPTSGGGSVGPTSGGQADGGAPGTGVPTTQPGGVEPSSSSASSGQVSGLAQTPQLLFEAGAQRLFGGGGQGCSGVQGTAGTGQAGSVTNIQGQAQWPSSGQEVGPTGRGPSETQQEATVISGTLTLTGESQS